MLWSILTIMMIAMLNVGFASCGHDDDDDKPNNTVVEEDDANPLVGSWIYQDEEMQTLFVFYSNGKFKVQEHSYIDNYNALFEGTYVYDEDDELLVLNITKTSDPEAVRKGEPLEYDVIQITSKKLILELLDEVDATATTFTKTKKTSL